ncbi:VapE domain-containing protein [Burkholderia gladioli]|uniref:VapE domain-containing protein n=1 Tax=Burkholderia gladioli TaxID=28095 RepID=UPI001641C618|nr:VapE domain-containing protein [Burkholderia gladioli]
MNRLDFAAINDALNAETVVPTWLPGGDRRGNEYVVANPTRIDNNPGSFTINLRQGNWKDFATGDGGADLVSLYAYIFHGNDQGAAARELADNHGIRIGDPETRERAAKVTRIEDAKPVIILPVPDGVDAPTFRHPRYGKPVATWAYRDRDGTLLMHVCRFDPEGERKQIIPYSWCKHPPKDGKPEHCRWTWKGITGGDKRPLYGMEKLTALPDADVIVVEGEKAADAGQTIFGDAAVVVTWMGGVETADRAHVKALAGRRVILWPDFDQQRDDGVLKPLHEQPGIRAMMHIAQALKGLARETHMVRYRLDDESFPSGWDLADAPAKGWDLRDVMQYMGENTGDPWHIASGQSQLMPAPAVPATNDDAGHSVSDIHDSQAVNPWSWPHVSDKGQPLNTIPNLRHLLANYGFTVRYDVIRKDLRVAYPGQRGTSDNQRGKSVDTISSLCALNRLPKADVKSFLLTIGDDNPVNPVTDFISSKPWDGRTRFADLLASVGTRPSYDRELFALLLRRWLISAVAAAARPSGFWSKGVLVFQGAQSLGKTAWFRSLLPETLRDLLKVDATINPDNKDSIISAVSHFLVELGELDGTLRKADIARLKGFISQDVDQFRRPYGITEEKFQRRTVFFASVNPSEFLADPTGNGRWWTVPVISVNPEHGIDTQQLWAEAFTWYEGGERWWLDRDEEARLEAVNDQHQQTSSVHELINTWYGDAPDTAYRRRVTATEVLLEMGYDKPTQAQKNDAGNALRKLFGDPKRTKLGLFFEVPEKAPTRPF